MSLGCQGFRKDDIVSLACLKDPEETNIEGSLIRREVEIEVAGSFREEVEHVEVLGQVGEGGEESGVSEVVEDR